MIDYVVIGGGVAGLYFGFSKSGNILILEKNKELGGRAITEKFGDYDVSISLGAGIGIVSRDNLLLELMRKLKFKYNTFFLDVYSESCQLILKKLYDNIDKIKPHMTFLQYMLIVLTPEEVNFYLKDSGYKDFQNANALTTILYYGLEYNCSKYMAIGIDWSALINKMSKFCNYETNCKVLAIEGNYRKFNVITTRGNFTTKNVVIATPINEIKLLLSDPIYDKVSAHPFMRVYASFDDISVKIMSDFFPKITLTHDILHFIIPMGENVWMVAYTDGDDAINLNKKLRVNSKIVLENYLYDLTRHKLKIKDVKIAFWEEGAHYYLSSDIDFNHLRNPEKGIYVIGEAVAKKQGWCNGALETVEEILYL